jgi:hypothetical protein
VVKKPLLLALIRGRCDDIRAVSRSEDKPFPDLLLLVTRTYVNLNPEEIGLKSCGLNTGMG